MLLLAIVAANLPWLSDRILFVLPPRQQGKPVSWCLLEWLLLYFLVGLLALGLERYASGGNHAQGWEFYAIGLFLFMVLAVPGFIWRQLWLPFAKRRRPRSSR